MQSRCVDLYLRAVVTTSGLGAVGAGADGGTSGRNSGRAVLATGAVVASGLGRARNLDGGVLNRGEDGGVALGDSSDRVGRNASSRGRADGNNGGVGLLALSGLSGLGDGGDGVVVPGRSSGDGGLGSGDRADGGRDSDNLGLDDGRVSRALSVLRTARGDGVGVGLVDGGGGHGDDSAGDVLGLGLSRAVSDGLGALGDSDHLSGVDDLVDLLSGDGGSKENGGGSELHFDGWVIRETKSDCWKE